MCKGGKGGIRTFSCNVLSWQHKERQAQLKMQASVEVRGKAGSDCRSKRTHTHTHAHAHTHTHTDKKTGYTRACVSCRKASAKVCGGIGTALGCWNCMFARTRCTFSGPRTKESVLTLAYSALPAYVCAVSCVCVCVLYLKSVCVCVCVPP